MNGNILSVQWSQFLPLPHSSPNVRCWASTRSLMHGCSAAASFLWMRAAALLCYAERVNPFSSEQFWGCAASSAGRDVGVDSSYPMWFGEKGFRKAVWAARDWATMLATNTPLQLPVWHFSLCQWRNNKTMEFCLMLWECQNHSFFHILLGSDVRTPPHRNSANDFRRVITVGQGVRVLNL